MLATIAGYGRRLQAGMRAILDDRGVVPSSASHPSMGGLFFAETPPTNYRDWRQSDYTFYDTKARHLHDDGVLCESDSREPWFVCEAHDEACLADTLEAFEQAVDATLDDLDGRTRKLARA